MFLPQAGFPTLARAEQLSFLDAYLLAVNNAPDVEVAKLRVDGAKARKDEALAALFPQANLFAQWSENRLSYEMESRFTRTVSIRGKGTGFRFGNRC